MILYFVFMIYFVFSRANAAIDDTRAHARVLGPITSVSLFTFLVLCCSEIGC